MTSISSGCVLTTSANCLAASDLVEDVDEVESRVKRRSSLLTPAVALPVSVEEDDVAATGVGGGAMITVWTEAQTTRSTSRLNGAQRSVC
jgi:hypothetical protein